MRTKRLAVSIGAIIAIGVCGFSRVALAQKEAQPTRQPAGAAGGAGDAQTLAITSSATVKAIDADNRIVTLQRPDGSTEDVKCGPEVRNFDQIKVGDEVRAAAMARMVMAIGQGAGESSPSGMVVGRSPKGGQPGAFVARTEQISAKVDAVDADKRTVTLSGIGDRPQTVQVSEDVDLSNVKSGDQVAIQVTKGFALWVERPSEAQPAAERIEPGGEGASAMEATSKAVTVAAIDPATHTITLKADDGRTRAIHCGNRCVNFDQVKVGDQIRATLADECAISVNKASAPAAADAAAAASETGSLPAVAARGARAGILVADTDDITARVRSVDSDKGTITLSLPDGSSKTVRCGPNVKLSELSAGDTISARITQPIAIIVERP
jgi:hypothetical protein